MRTIPVETALALPRTGSENTVTRAVSVAGASCNRLRASRDTYTEHLSGHNKRLGWRNAHVGNQETGNYPRDPVDVEGLRAFPWPGMVAFAFGRDLELPR